MTSFGAPGAASGAVPPAAPDAPKRRPMFGNLAQEIGEDHPNGLSRLDHLDGVGRDR
ncbi:hypothetical protein [Microbacterium hydrocarbonoxydans]|uniref:hypothetical protein n=1 Tax=Microbacterium hydrocarbonoxydans TaxID=273678 RepID=UPI000A9DC3EE|nr:hypothetical protein [Microbacterium hydrocarbonoxydans]